VVSHATSVISLGHLRNKPDKHVKSSVMFL